MTRAWKGKLCSVTLEPVADQELSTNEVALRLGVSRPTVRKLLRAGLLVGREEPRGATRFSLRIDEESVAAYLEAQGGTDGSRRQGKRVTVSQLRDELNQLREEIRTHVKTGGSTADSGLHAEVLALREAVLQQRAITDAIAAADQARAEVVRHLLAAVTASEIADERRRDALSAAQATIGQFVIPGNTESLAPSTRDHG